MISGVEKFIVPAVVVVVVVVVAVFDVNAPVRFSSFRTRAWLSGQYLSPSLLYPPPPPAFAFVFASFANAKFPVQLSSMFLASRVLSLVLLVFCALARVLLSAVAARECWEARSFCFDSRSISRRRSRTFASRARVEEGEGEAYVPWKVPRWEEVLNEVEDFERKWAFEPLAFEGEGGPGRRVWGEGIRFAAFVVPIDDSPRRLAALSRTWMTIWDGMGW